jgi:hypothetical protein
MACQASRRPSCAALLDPPLTYLTRLIAPLGGEGVHFRRCDVAVVIEVDRTEVRRHHRHAGQWIIAGARSRRRLRRLARICTRLTLRWGLTLRRHIRPGRIAVRIVRRRRIPIIRRAVIVAARLPSPRVRVVHTASEQRCTDRQRQQRGNPSHRSLLLVRRHGRDDHLRERVWVFISHGQCDRGKHSRRRDRCQPRSRAAGHAQGRLPRRQVHHAEV